jgi:hypothetical protein
MGLGLLALSQAPRSQGFQGLMGLMAAQDQAKQLALDSAWQQQARERQQKEWDAKDAAAAQAAKVQAAIPGLFGKTTQGSVSIPEIGGVPFVSQGAQVTEPSMRSGGFNVQEALRLGLTPKQIQEYADLENVGRQEVARTVEGMENGRPVTLQYDKYGQPVGRGVEQWKAPVQVNRGDRVDFVSPVTLQQQGSFGINMSPSERDASARGWANQALARERFNAEQQQGSKPTFNAETGTWVYAPSPANPQGAVVPVPGFQKPLNDVQAKAQLFGTRMQEADKILQQLQANGKTFSTPGANLPFVGGLVNAVNSEQGQMLDQAKRDFTNAVLRRESGAAIAQSEFDSADRQYFPQPGDSDKVIAQKARARQIAIQGVLSEVPKGTPPINVDGAKGATQRPPANIPLAAINDLKMRGPAAKAQFDEVFGPGAADSVLGAR